MSRGNKGEVILTKNQKTCVDFNSGDLVIKGIAGAGKSIVLIKRALKYNREALRRGERVRIAIFTYAKTLVHYTNELINGQDIATNMIEVSTIDKYCYNLYMRMYRRINGGEPPRLIKYKKEMIQQAIKNHHSKSKVNHRFYKLEDDFWITEFQWIKEKRIKNVKEYISCSREGRGSKIRMSIQDKQIAYELYEEYNKLLKRRNKVEWEDIYAYILDNKDNIAKSAYFDYVLVDEAQDLSFIKLCVAKLLTTRDITIAADQAQKIYNTSFTWKEIGINIHGKSSKKLSSTFRSTKQIIALADSLLSHNKNLLKQQDEYIKPVLPEAEGEIPLIIKCRNEEHESKTLCELIKQMLEQDDEQTIGILYRTKNERAKIVKWLGKAKILYEEIQGDEGWSLLNPGVKLVTMHSAKGLEVDAVIIPQMCEDIIPYLPRDYDEEQLDELLERERSIVYVGMTRARETLIFLYSGVKSRFLSEMDNKLYNNR